MTPAYVYHVVTEKAMQPGQKIFLGPGRYNGVYERVQVCQRLLAGEEIPGDLAQMIKKDLTRWAKVTYREIALEAVRAKSYPQYPSRMACLYTSRTLDEAISWAEFFKESGRDVYAVVKLSVQGSLFDADATNCFDGTEDEEDNLIKAGRYWENSTKNPDPVIETLADGEITVVEIVKAYR